LSSATDGRAETGASRIYRVLRDDILSLRMAPGAMVDEPALAERFGVSRSPVREALVRLSADGLIVAPDNRSSAVAAFDVRDLSALFVALDLLQRATTRLAARNPSPDEIERLISLNRVLAEPRTQESIDAVVEANHQFHVAVAEAAKNRYLATYSARTLDESRRLLHLYYRALGPGTENFGEIIDEHAAIIDAIQRRDMDAAEQIAGRHCAQFQKRVVQIIAPAEPLSVSVDHLAGQSAPKVRMGRIPGKK